MPWYVTRLRGPRGPGWHVVPPGGEDVRTACDQKVPHNVAIHDDRSFVSIACQTCRAVLGDLGEPREVVGMVVDGPEGLTHAARLLAVAVLSSGKLRWAADAGTCCGLVSVVMPTREVGVMIGPAMRRMEALKDPRGSLKTGVVNCLECLAEGDS